MPKREQARVYPDKVQQGMNPMSRITLLTVMLLTNLISGRGFDRFQAGLISRFKSFGFQYQLTYCEPTINPAMRLDFDSPLHRGQVTVWESGSCDLEVLDASTGEVVFNQHHELSSEMEFHQTYPALVLFMRDALERQTTETP